jgi:hypothetical protein
MMLDAQVEQRILLAIKRGEFDDLPGSGKPLDLEDDRLIPEELRLAHRILKNAGYVPKEIQLFNQLAQLEMQCVGRDEVGDAIALKKLRIIRDQIEASNSRLSVLLRDRSEYVSKLIQRVSKPKNQD